VTNLALVDATQNTSPDLYTHRPWSLPSLLCSQLTTTIFSCSLPPSYLLYWSATNFRPINLILLSLNHTSFNNMDNSTAKRRDSMNSPPMSQMPAAPVSQRIYISCNGAKLPEEQFMHIFGQARAGAHRQGQQFPNHGHHELMWMLQQHHPGHPFLKGRYYNPPPNTHPRVLQYFGFVAGQQRPPQALSPNMLPSAMTQGGHPAVRQAGRSMSIDPRLVNASVAVNPQILGSSGPVPMQPTTHTPEMESPSSVSSAGSTAWSPSGRSLSSRSQLSTTASLGPPSARLPVTGSRAPSAPYMPDVRSPSQPSPYKIDQSQAAQPPTPSHYPSPTPSLPSTLASRRAACSIAGPAGQNSRMTLFLPIGSSPTSAQDNTVPLQRSNGVQITDEKGPGQMSTLEMRVVEHFKKLPAELKAKVAVRLQQDPIWRPEFVAQMNVRDKVLAAKRLQTQPRPPSATPQREPTKELAELTSKKRKQPSTATGQPPTKRKVIDLTDDNESRPKEPANATQQLHTKRPVIDLTDNSKFQREQQAVLPIRPESSNLPSIGLLGDACDALHLRALEHGVHVSEVELYESIHLGHLDWIQDHKNVRAANCLLDPSESKLWRVARANAAQERPSYVPEPTIAAAVKNVKSGKFDFQWSGTLLTAPPPPSSEMLVQMGCTLDEDGELRAPEEPVMSEERAQLEWDMLPT
jgi:hypothetical protein